MELFNILPCITFCGSIYWLNKMSHRPCLKLNFLSFDTKHNTLWTNLPDPCLTQLTFFSRKCWHPNLPIAVEIRLDKIISQMKPNFVILHFVDWSAVKMLKICQIWFVTQNPTIFKVLYLLSKVTDCNKWDVVGKVNTWVFR